MLKVILLFSLIILLPLKNISLDNNHVNDFFTLEKTIKLPNEPIIGQVSFLDVDNKENLLITDIITNNVFLYNNQGYLITTLSPEKCNPGTFWSPLKAVFDNEGDIFVINRGPWGIRFDKSGDCTAIMGRQFMAPLHIAFDHTGNIYGYYIAPDGNYLKKMDQEGNEITRFGLFEDEFKNFINIVEGGGLISDLNGYLYHTNVTSYKVHKYNINGEYITTFDQRPSYYSPIRKDLSRTSGNPNIMIEFRNIIKNRSITYDLHLLDQDRLLIQYRLGSLYGIDIFDTEGNRLINENIIVKRPFFSARDGYAYYVAPHEYDDDGNIRNPNIEIYNILSNQIDQDTNDSN